MFEKVKKNEMCNPSKHDKELKQWWEVYMRTQDLGSWVGVCQGNKTGDLNKLLGQKGNKFRGRGGNMLSGDSLRQNRWKS